MNKQIVIAILLFILLTTINPHHKITSNKFELKEIQIENNFLLNKEEIKKLLAETYGKNLIFLKSNEIENALMKNSFIESFIIKKKYPNTLKIKIFEKKPIAILINKKNKFYLSEKNDLIKFRDLKNYNNLPYVFGNKKNFKIIYDNLKKINFPLTTIKNYTFFESNRWDLETVNKKIIKLPTNNYTNSLENYLEMTKKKNFNQYKIFDYRINNQLILK